MQFNRLIPELKVTNLGRSLEFYTKVLGFKKEYERLESRFAFLSFKGSQIMIEEMGNDNWVAGAMEHPYGRGIHLQIQVDSIRPIIAALKVNNYPVFIKPHEKWYRVGAEELGNKQFLVQDPDGYLLRFFEDLGARKVTSKK